jgi:hypothetical protein
MRDQMWKTIQFGILFFIGVVGLDITTKNKSIVILAYTALFLTSFIGLIVATHLRKRQKEKFRIIRKYEEELKIYDLIKDIITDSKKGLFGRIDTSFFILFIHIFLMTISAVSAIFIILGLPGIS